MCLTFYREDYENQNLNRIENYHIMSKPAKVEASINIHIQISVK